MKYRIKGLHSIWVALLKPYSATPKECVKIMVSSIYWIKANCADFTYVIKVSNSSKNNLLLCISKNEVNEKKKGVSVCLSTRNQIKDDMIFYDRTKYDKQARVIIIDKAAEIMERYKNEASMNYIFPTIKRCNPTQQKLYGRVKRKMRR